LRASSHGRGSKFGRRKSGDVVVGVNGEGTHIQTPSAVDYRDHDIHPSGSSRMQANSAGLWRSQGDGVFQNLAGFGS